MNEGPGFALCPIHYHIVAIGSTGFSSETNAAFIPRYINNNGRNFVRVLLGTTIVMRITVFRSPKGLAGYWRLPSGIGREILSKIEWVG
jgi:hypothetical protein